jgi:hypothetical protein
VFHAWSEEVVIVWIVGADRGKGRVLSQVDLFPWGSPLARISQSLLACVRAFVTTAWGAVSVPAGSRVYCTVSE